MNNIDVIDKMIVYFLMFFFKIYIKFLDIKICL